MAYQARRRDPLLDSHTQAAIEKRGKELFGLASLTLGVFFTLLLISYIPEDPSWLSATDEPARNMLGRFGASIASPLFIIVGFGAWAIPFVFVVWGLRFILHRGDERALGRVIFAPLVVALAAVYASTHVPVSEWTHSFGLGGLFGDTVLGAILGVAPVQAIFGLKVLAALVFVSLVALSLYVLGFDRTELQMILRFMMVSVVLTYAAALRLLGVAGSGAAKVARRANDIRLERREARTARIVESEAQQPPVATPPLKRTAIVHPEISSAEIEPVTEEKPSLFSRMQGFKRAAMAEPEVPEIPEEDDDPETRIRSKISEVIRNRATRATPLEMAVASARRKEPSLTRQSFEDTQIAEPEDLYPVEPEVSWSEPDPQVAERIVVPEPKAVVQHPVKKSTAPSKKAQAEAQPSLFKGPSSDFELPALNLLTSPDTVQRHVLSDEALEENARMLEAVLDDYGVKGEIVSVRPGPVVTMYELEPAPGLKASRVIGLADDIARSMSALSARVSTVPGRSVIGIELPNEKREIVVLREILAGREFGDGNHQLPLALGKEIGGEPIVANLAKMPHLLIAGTTGSGKSVAINTMILSLVYKLTPEECRLIMIDPKMLELSVYDGIPHLLSPVVTDPKKAVVALKWVVGEMEERYRKMSKMGVRNIDGYNSRVKDALAKDEMFSRTVQTGFDDETGDPVFETEEFQPESMPYIVVIVDEMADLMMVAGKEIEACIQRLAQMARASGIHLIMATQRPSVDVITGTIKANFPTRISFQVTSKIDSRTILGEMGAEQLLGMGDMLFMAGGSKITRVHGPFVSDEEVEDVVNHLKSFGPPEYFSGVVDGPDEDKSNDIDVVLGLGGNTDGEDALYDQAVQIVINDRKCSTSYIQRKLAIGYNKAARLVEQMEDQGLVSAANHVGKRDILVPEQ